MFELLLPCFGLGLRALRLYRRGLDNALDLGLTSLDLPIVGLPPAFDGFTILQMSDLHVDALPGTLEAALRVAERTEPDICVLTGDFRKAIHGPFAQALAPLASLVARVRARDGIYAVLGNHDCADMVPALESLGIAVLVNETQSLRRGGAWLHLTGTDDVHYFYTPAARSALDDTPEGVKVALVHSAEAADLAAASGFHLYLAGHSHAGQVCLPGGRPIITHMVCHRRYAAGLWRHGAMLGYTSSGVGVSGLPVRFNCRGEVALLTLRRAQDVVSLR